MYLYIMLLCQISKCFFFYVTLNTHIFLSRPIFISFYFYFHFNFILYAFSVFFVCISLRVVVVVVVLSAPISVHVFFFEGSLFSLFFYSFFQFSCMLACLFRFRFDFVLSHIHRHTLRTHFSLSFAWPVSVSRIFLAPHSIISF